MNELRRARSLDVDNGLSTPSSNGHSNNEKHEIVNVQTIGDEERVPIVDSSHFPEGGVRAWLAVTGAFLVQFTGFGYINSFGVYQDFYVREYLTASTPSEIGWIGGVQVFLNFSLGAFTGRLFDRGYFYHLMISGVVIHAISVFTLSLSQKNVYYQVFLTNGVGVGLASGLTYTASLAIPGHYFRRRRSLAVGIISSGSALGAVIHPIMLNRLINGPVGFHSAVKISAAINVFLLVVAACLTRTRLPPKELQRFPIMQWLKEPGYLAFFVSAIFCFMGLFFPVFYLQLNAITHGVDRKFAFYALSILNASSFFGRTIPAAIAHKFGVFNLGTVFTIGTGTIILSMIGVKDLAGTVTFSIIFGLFSGACIALTPAMIAHLANDANEFGTRLGLYFGFGGILGLFATPISGALLTSQYHWVHPILLAGISMIMTGVLYVIARHFVSKREGSQII
ncbi:hypothetical protein M413DRAFT_242415 [Hebeloma cylindrosporum]|uniref:Major facilitator superfamily (MFS) profile domain-containing protein n=1 Tax=Hebeloma cylindrosporum TaxID=76867 RepID=A0A0C3C4H3_HEBCY|nr:hypothetical protein M413DRAFT_242415 [Hebeloma cylindrosporum h7]